MVYGNVFCLDLSVPHHRVLRCGSLQNKSYKCEKEITEFLYIWRWGQGFGGSPLAPEWGYELENLLNILFSVWGSPDRVISYLDPCDNSTLVTTRPSWQLDPCDNSTLVTTRPSWQLDPRDNSTLVTTRPTTNLCYGRDKGRIRIDPVKIYNALSWVGLNDDVRQRKCGISKPSCCLHSRRQSDPISKY